MIQENELIIEGRTWQQSLADLVTDSRELLAILGLRAQDVGMSELASEEFACRVPREFIKKIKPGDPRDPLLLQVLPTKQELLLAPGFSPDALGESAVNPIPGLLHKYKGRVLLTLSGSCAVNCRYCFRRHFPYQKNNPGIEGWQAAVNYVAQDDSISEIIYSGGEPLLLKDTLLAELSKKFAAIKHVKILRIHTRLPVVIPQRITEEFCQWLKNLPLKTVVVIHCNHPNEIDSTLREALNMLRLYGVLVLNQSVLLKNINDDAIVLKELSEKLFSADVLPYYLHVLDKVKGAAHFDIGDGQAVKIHQELQGILPGYLVPKLVRECAGAGAKVLVK